MGAELAEEIGEKPDKVRELLGFCRQPMSLDRKVGEALETDLGELLPDDRLDPDERMAREMLSWQYEKIRQRSSLQFGVQLDHITRDNQNTTLSIPMGWIPYLIYVLNSPLPMTFDFSITSERLPALRSMQLLYQFGCHLTVLLVWEWDDGAIKEGQPLWNRRE